MTKPLRFDDEAVEDLESAAAWYEPRRQSLGIEFVAAICEALLRISNLPQTCPLVPNVPERLHVRRFVLRRFPYSVVFLDLVPPRASSDRSRLAMEDSVQTSLHAIRAPCA